MTTALTLIRNRGAFNSSNYNIYGYSWGAIQTHTACCWWLRIDDWRLKAYGRWLMRLTKWPGQTAAKPSSHRAAKLESFKMHAKLESFKMHAKLELSKCTWNLNFQNARETWTFKMHTRNLNFQNALETWTSKMHLKLELSKCTRETWTFKNARETWTFKMHAKLEL